MRNFVSTMRLPIILVSIYAIFHVWFEQVLTHWIVDPFLSKAILEGNAVGILGYIVIICCIIGWLCQKIYAGYRFSDSWLIWSSVILLFYLYYRFFSNVWHFTTLWYRLNATDILVLLPFFLIVARIKNYLNPEDQPIISNSGFIHDDPITIKKEDDKHERHRFINEIKDRLLKTPKGQGSFCIGVIGSWGAGKTTFLNSLKLELKSSDEVIQFDFSPWVKADVSSLTEAFFKEFSFQLSNHTDILQEHVEKYARLLIGNNGSSAVGRIVQYLFPSVRWDRASVENSKHSISSMLEKLGKKVVVFVDDIDRLNFDEIQEVFKLVRNSAGFPNVFYVIAFDRAQVENSLKPRFESGNYKYLEKILQLEFYLPPINRDLLLQELINELIKRLSKDEVPLLHRVFKEVDEFNEASHRWIKRHIYHHRDLIRFLNQFDLHYKFVKGNVYLPDFLAIMVLRLRYPGFYYYFYRNRYKILAFKEQHQRDINDEGEMTLAGIDEKSTGYKGTILYQLLQNGLPEAGIEKDDFGPLDILENVFESPQRNGRWSSWPVMRSGIKYHLSIKFSQYFTRYFDYSFAGRLSDVDFGEALYDSKEIFMKKIEEWCATKSIGLDVIASLEGVAEFSDKFQFEKVNSALVFIANSSFNGHVYYVDTNLFLNKFSMGSKNRRRLLSIYSSNNEIETFLLRQLSENAKAGNWSYMIANQISNEPHGTYAIDPREASKVVTSACEEFFKTPRIVDYDFGVFAKDWEINSSRLGNRSPNDKIKMAIFRDLKQGIKLFVGPCQEHYNQGRYRFFDDKIKAIFTDRATFINEISAADSLSGDELIKFANVIAEVETDSRHCAPFDFNVLGVERIDPNDIFNSI